MQIDLRRTHVAMAEIRRKVWKCSHDVALGFFQLLHRTNGKGNSVAIPCVDYVLFGIALVLLAG